MENVIEEITKLLFGEKFALATKDFRHWKCILI
jgi:hypothetical protein